MVAAAIGSMAGLTGPAIPASQGSTGQYQRGKEVADALKLGAEEVMQAPTEQNAISTLDGVARRYGVPSEHFDPGKAAIYAAKNDPDEIRRLMGGLGAKMDQALAQLGNSGATGAEGASGNSGF